MATGDSTMRKSEAMWEREEKELQERQAKRVRRESRRMGTPMDKSERRAKERPSKGLGKYINTGM